MRVRNLLAAAAVATISTSALTAGTAFADPTGDSTVTFEVAAGTLDITVSAATDLGSGTPGGTPISGDLGSAEVDDTRAALDASWQVQVTCTDFVTGGGTEPETIPASDISYWSGDAFATTGTGTFTPGQSTVDDAEPLDNSSAVTAFTHSDGSGNNSTVWSPGLLVSIPPAGVAGTYTGTMTHSVA